MSVVETAEDLRESFWPCPCDWCQHLSGGGASMDNQGCQMEIRGLEIRGPRPGDQRYVANVMCEHLVSEVSRRSPRRSKVWAESCMLVDKLLDDSSTQILLSVRSDDRDAIVGFLVTSAAVTSIPVVHFAYVRRYARGRGVMRSLVARATPLDPEKTFAYTFRVQRYVDKFPRAVYIPLEEYLK